MATFRRYLPAPRHVKRVVGGARSIIWALVAALAAVLATTGLSTYFFAQSVTNSFNNQRTTVDIIGDGPETGDDLADAVTAADDSELNILLLGSDERPEGDESGVEGSRTDTMMFVHIPEGHDKVYVMSIVRDLWVPIPGYGTSKVNGAYDLGGYPAVVDTVEELTGSHIDHLAVVDFEGFRGLTEAVGGVNVENEVAFYSGQVNPSFFPEGTIKLEGTDALRYVRERQAFPEGDYQRVKNQQTFIKGLVDQLLTAEVLANPAVLGEVVNTISPYLTVDEDLDAGAMISYGMSLGNITSDDIEMFTIPNNGTGTSADGQSIIYPDEYGLSLLQEAIDTGTMDEFLAEYIRPQEVPSTGSY